MEKNAYDTVRHLMAFGAAPPAYEGDPNGPPVYTGNNITFREELSRQTALTYFIKQGNNFSIIFTLLCNGADVNLPNSDDVTPLQAAVTREWPYVAMQLVKAGAWKDPETPDVNEIVDKRTGMTRLMAVILEGRDGNAVKSIVEQGADLNKADYNGITPIALARAVNWAYVEELLIKHGAEDKPFPDPNQLCGDKTLLGYALSYQGAHGNYIYGLLDAGADPDMVDEDGKTALHWAAVFGRTDMFAEMLALGADINALDSSGMKPLHYACMNGCTDIASIILDTTQNADINTPVGESARTPLMLAAGRQEAYDLVQLLIDRGALVNMQDLRARTPLTEAVSSRDLQMVKCLIENGADVAKQLEPPSKENMCADTLHYNAPLFTLVNSPNENNLAIARLLLDAGASPNDVAIERFNGPQKGDSLIHFAIRYHADALAELLLEAGADPHGTSHCGETAMHYCLNLRHIEGVKILLKHGFDPLRHFDYSQTWSNSTVKRHEGSCLDEARKLVEQFGKDTEYGQMLTLIEEHIAAKTPRAAPRKKVRTAPEKKIK
jgi:ankyrin repeat protein